jgi:hypothetical protein
MLTISVQSDIEAARRKLSSITEARQLRFATAVALTRSAREVQAEVRKNMPSRFTLRRDWVLKGIQVEKAKPADLVATVFSRDTFMGLQEAGGPKSPLRNYLAIPTKAVRRTPRDIIRKADRPKALGDKAEVVEVKGHKYLALKKARRGRNGNGQLRLLYLLVPRAQIKARLGLAQDGMQVVRARFPDLLRQALAEAVARAR